MSILKDAGIAVGYFTFTAPRKTGDDCRFDLQQCKHTDGRSRFPLPSCIVAYGNDFVG